MMFFDVRHATRTRILRVTPKVLTRALQLPKDTEVMEIGRDGNDQLYLVVSSATFAEGSVPLEHALREPKPARRRRPTRRVAAPAVPA